MRVFFFLCVSHVAIHAWWEDSWWREWQAMSGTRLAAADAWMNWAPQRMPIWMGVFEQVFWVGVHFMSHHSEARETTEDSYAGVTREDIGCRLRCYLPVSDTTRGKLEEEAVNCLSFNPSRYLRRHRRSYLALFYSCCRLHRPSCASGASLPISPLRRLPVISPDPARWCEARLDLAA